MNNTHASFMKYIFLWRQLFRVLVFFEQKSLDESLSGVQFWRLWSDMSADYLGCRITRNGFADKCAQQATLSQTSSKCAHIIWECCIIWSENLNFPRVFNEEVRKWRLVEKESVEIGFKTLEEFRLEREFGKPANSHWSQDLREWLFSTTISSKLGNQCNDRIKR